LAAIQRQFSVGLPDAPHRDHRSAAGKEYPQLWQVWATTVLTGVSVSVGYAQYQQAKLANEQAKLANVEAFKNSDEYKVQEAVKKFMQKQPPADEDDEVVTAFVGRLKDRLTGWGTDRAAAHDMKYRNVHATVMTGLFEAGKSTALKQAMAGMSGVLTVQLQDEPKCKAAVYKELGVTGEFMFTEVIRRVTKELKGMPPMESITTAAVPVIVLEIPRYSGVSINTVSTFSKAYATDAFSGERVHVLAVMSSATAAIGFDAGGPNRRFDLFMAFNEQEAIEFLNKKEGITNTEVAATIVRFVGTNPGRLQHANVKLMAEAIENNKDDDEVMASISTEYHRRVQSEVRALLAIEVFGHGGKGCFVGREMVAVLMNSESTSHAEWQQKNITLASVAQNIKNVGGHAVYYHTEKEAWFFVSKLHRVEAEKQLKQMAGGGDVELSREHCAV
jgi:hypothetical protein